MKILPRKETIFLVYPLVIGQLIISAGHRMSNVLLLILSASVIICLVFDVCFLVKQIQKLMGGR